MSKRSARTTRRAGLVLVLVALCSPSLGCNEEQVERAERGRGAPPHPPAAAPVAAKPAQTDTLSFKDDDFVESEHNRDPFREYASAFRVRGAEVSSEVQRTVIMPTTPVEAMRLIAIISGMPRPKAMLVDPLGVGYVVERGDYIGRPKVLQASGSVSMTLNWRVDRIRENEVVLTRQDPTDPNRPPLSRIITLRQELAAK